MKLIIVLNFVEDASPLMSQSTRQTVRGSQTGAARCECGQLIAKVREQGLEVKCKRCKRIVLIPFPSIKGDLFLST